MRGLRLVAGLAVVLATAGCAGWPDGQESGSKPAVVAGFYPLAEIARRVGGDLIRVTDLTPAGTEPHDLELDSSQVDAVEDATVVLYLGGGFQPALDRAAQRSTGAKVDVLGEADGGDPHIWLDPVRMQAVVEQVRDALVLADRNRRGHYEQAARQYLVELADLDADFAEGLAECERRTIVTAHDAFGHLARRYRLQQEAITGLAPESEPDPRRLGQLADLVRRSGVTTVFTEALVPPDVAETLAREAGVRTAVLDPIEGLTPARRSAGSSYQSVMRENLATLREALGCR